MKIYVRLFKAIHKNDECITGKTDRSTRSRL